MPARITITHAGRTLTIREWAEVTGLPEARIRLRYQRRFSPAAILSQSRLGAMSNRHDKHYPLKKKPPIKLRLKRRGRPAVKITHEGKSMTFNEWAQVLGVEVSTLRNRHRAGLPLSSPVKIAIPSHRPIAKPKVKPTTRSTPITFDGETKPLDVWAFERSLPLAKVLSRFKAGEPVDACFARVPAPPTPARERPSRPPVPRMKVPSLADLDDLDAGRVRLAA